MLIHQSSDLRMILVFKASRDMIQTALFRGAFHFYLVPTQIDDVSTFGLATAFFDDNDEPLIIRTPLFMDEFTDDFKLLLSSDSFYVHFFDEHSRELLSFRAENPSYHRFRILSSLMGFVSPTLGRARQVLDAIDSWFGARTSSDDDAAFSIYLRERRFPDCLTENVDNPGELNELDIAMALHRNFETNQVIQNPIRADNRREFVDVLVETPNTLVLIQAKDSPRTESTLSRNITRKKDISAKHVKKATRQLKGSIDYLQSEDQVEIIADGKFHNVDTSGRDIYGLVIVKELFDADRPISSTPVLSIFDETGIPCILLDQNEFQQLTFFRNNEQGFLAALEDIFSVAYVHRAFPRSRFGLRDGKSVVFKPNSTENALGSTPYESAPPVKESSLVSVTRLTEDLKVGVTAEMGLHGDLDAPWLRVVVDRSEVEVQDVSGTALKLARVLADRQSVERYRGNVDLAFFGYSKDPRELYEIPEVRQFCSKLDDAFPYWFYFLSTDRVTLLVIACCLCSVTQVRPGVVSLGSDQIEFITQHYDAQNWLFDNYSLDEEHNVVISGKIAEYFNKFEPIQ